METLERAAHARSVATAKGRRLGRPTVIDAEQLDYANHLRDTGHTINEIVVAKPESPRTSLYRHLPPREPEPLTLGTTPRRWRDTCWRIRDGTSPLQSKDVPLEQVVWIDPLVA